MRPANRITKPIPPLVPGGTYTREEFLHIWEMHPEIKKAELIGGIVFMPSPLSMDHGVYDHSAGLWSGTYQVNTPGVQAASNPTLLLLEETVQPDQCLRLLPQAGGKTKITDTFLDGPPELIVEVCRSSHAHDLHQKYFLYQEAGVQEYLAILLYEKEIRWHGLDAGQYRPLVPDSRGVYRSCVFPGLWLDSQAFLEGDTKKVLRVLQKGLASAEHKAFAKRLTKLMKAGNP